MNSVWIVWYTVDNEGHPKCCGVYATERVARAHMEDLSDVYKITERPDITHERLRQMRAKAVRRWRENTALAARLEASLKENAALSDNLAISNTAAVELEAKLEKCIAVLKDLPKEEMYSYASAKALLKELGIE